MGDLSISLCDWGCLGGSTQDLRSYNGEQFIHGRESVPGWDLLYLSRGEQPNGPLS